MNKRQRVIDAITHKTPDRTPTDFQATPEIWQKMFSHFKTNDMKVVLDNLEIDCAWVDPQVSRPATNKDADGYLIGWGGSKIQMVANPYGEYEEIIKYATDGCETISQIDKALDLPNLDLWNFESIARACDKYHDRFLLGGFASTFYYPTLVRRLEDLLIDMALNPPLAKHLIKRCFDWHMDYHTRLFNAAEGRLDAMQIADDYATQLDLLISKDMFKEFFKEPFKEYVNMAKSHGAIPYLHCCGSAYHLINEFIEIGVEILDPIQTVARNMEVPKLKEEFGNKLTFHGGGETQNILPQGTVEEVKENASYLSRNFGKNGGYIMTSCHFLQPDVPTENILAFYDVANRANH